MRYDEVAIDRAADADEIAVGSHVIFKQGEYVLPQQGTRGHRYHKARGGVVPAMRGGRDSPMLPLHNYRAW